MSGHFALAGGNRVRFAGPASARSSYRLRMAARARTESLHSLLSLRGLRFDVLLLLLYVALGRAFIGDEAALGIKIGPLPLFITDAVLLLLIGLNLYQRGGRTLHWFFGGGGAGDSGRAVWVLFLLAVIYCLAALPQYKIMALHDFAIFGYCLFFPLAYFGLRQPAQAAKLVRYSIYATCLGALLFNFQVFSGVHLFALAQNGKDLAGHEGAVLHTSANNLGADLGPGLAGLFAYFAVQRKHRLFHGAAILLCLVTLAQLMDRSALLGFAMAAGMMFALGVGRSRVYLSVLAAALCALVLVSAQGELPFPGGARLHNFWLSVSSGANIENDPDGQFRLQRWGRAAAVWLTSPVFGVGFGVPLMLDAGDALRSEEKGAAERGALGAFNVGMPHNSFLMALTRTGVIGLCLICFAWFGGILRIARLAMPGLADADQMAAAAALVAMISTAGLNLFFERPMLCAPFWIILAASYRLAEAMAQPRPAGVTIALAQRTQPIRPRPRRTSQNKVAGGWQARWK